MGSVYRSDFRPPFARAHGAHDRGAYTHMRATRSRQDAPRFSSCTCSQMHCGSCRGCQRGSCRAYPRRFLSCLRQRGSCRGLKCLCARVLRVPKSWQNKAPQRKSRKLLDSSQNIGVLTTWSIRGRLLAVIRNDRQQVAEAIGSANRSMS